MIRLFRNIIMLSLFLVLLANVALFVFNSDLALPSNRWVLIRIYLPLDGTNYEYRGFRYFAEYLKTFPALINSISVLNNVNSILSGTYEPGGNEILGVLYSISYILCAPVTLLFTVILDVINNVYWIFGFFVPQMFS